MSYCKLKTVKKLRFRLESGEIIYPTYIFTPESIIQKARVSKNHVSIQFISGTFLVKVELEHDLEDYNEFKRIVKLIWDNEIIQKEYPIFPFPEEIVPYQGEVKLEFTYPRTAKYHNSIEYK